jgi:hypothetical protein
VAFASLLIPAGHFGLPGGQAKSTALTLDLFPCSQCSASDFAGIDIVFLQRDKQARFYWPRKFIQNLGSGYVVDFLKAIAATGGQFPRAPALSAFSACGYGISRHTSSLCLAVQTS